MPDRILRIVAGLLATCCVAGFVLGVVGAPSRGRLPGETGPGGSGAPMAAADAVPLNSEELGPPKPPEPIAQEIDEDDRPEPPPPKIVVKPAEPIVLPSPDPVGALLEPTPEPTPAQEDPPF